MIRAKINSATCLIIKELTQVDRKNDTVVIALNAIPITLVASCQPPHLTSIVNAGIGLAVDRWIASAPKLGSVVSCGKVQ